MQAVLITVWLSLFGLFVLGSLITVLRGTRVPASPPRIRPVSILLPVKGPSEMLERNLSALERVAPMCREIVIGVARADDPALPLITRTARRQRDKIVVAVGEVAGYANPKLRNLANLYRRSGGEIVFLLDDSVALDADLFGEIIAGLDQGSTGAISAAPIAEPAPTFAGEIERATCNGYLFRIQNGLAVFGRAAGFGNALAFRRADLEAAGGIARLAEGPCEDNALTKALRSRGLGVALARRGATRMIGRRTWRDLWHRHLRWKHCARYHDPATFLLEPWQNPLAVAALGGVALAMVIAIPWWIGFGANALATYAIEFALHRILRWPVGWRTPPSWIGRDLLHPAITVAALFTRELEWRGARLTTRRSRGT